MGLCTLPFHPIMGSPFPLLRKVPFQDDFFFNPHCYVLRIWPLGTNPIKHAERGRGQLAYWVRDLKLGGGCLYPYSFH